MNNRVNNIKFICAIMVVLIHLNIGFYYAYNKFLFENFFFLIGRFSVPFFLIASGYFWFPKKKRDAIYKFLILQFILITLTTLESGVLLNIFSNYVQMSPPSWYLPAVILMMLVALPLEKRGINALFIALLILSRFSYFANFPETIGDFFTYGYMFYFGYILRSLLENKNIANVVYKSSNIFLILFLILEVSNVFVAKLQYNQDTIFQFIAAILLALYAFSENKDKEHKITKYSLDLFLYHILVLSLITFFNKSFIFDNVTSISYLGFLFILELVLAIFMTLIIGRIIRLIDEKYLKIIY